MKSLVQLVRFCAVTAVFLMAGRAAVAEDAPKKQILFFSKSSGYEHDMVKRANGQLSAAEKIVQELAKMVGGSGGGRPDLAEAGGKDTSAIESTLRNVYPLLDRLL